MPHLSVIEAYQCDPIACSYVFFLFNQPRGFDQQTLVNSTTSISDFNISAFASEVGLGNPVGGTFILVGPDPPSA